jgi:hypothetical protein
MTCFPMNSANTFKTTNILFADARKRVPVSCNQQFFFKFFWILSGWFLEAKDIFPLGCCDYRAFHYVSSTSCAHNRVIALPVEHWPIVSAVRVLNQIVTHHYSDICLFSKWEQVFPKFLTWLITYLQHTCSSPLESHSTCSKKQGHVSASLLSCRDQNTSLIERQP